MNSQFEEICVFILFFHSKKHLIKAACISNCERLVEEDMEAVNKKQVYFLEDYYKEFYAFFKTITLKWFILIAWKQFTVFDRKYFYTSITCMLNIDNTLKYIKDIYYLGKVCQMFSQGFVIWFPCHIHVYTPHTILIRKLRYEVNSFIRG